MITTINNIHHTIYANIHKLRITKENTNNMTPLGAHFGRKCNTPASNFATRPNTKNLNYNKMIKFY